MPEIKEDDLKETKPPFDFREERNTVFYHDIRMFIFGADVTPWLTSSVTLSRADRNGINTLSFELSNVNRAFEITENNIGPEGNFAFKEGAGVLAPTDPDFTFQEGAGVLAPQATNVGEAELDELNNV